MKMNKIWKLCVFIGVFIFPHVVSSQVNNFFNKVWLEFNVTSGDDVGMTIHADFNVIGMKGKKIQVISFFYDEKKNKHFGNTPGFIATDNHICVSDIVTPSYEKSHYSNFKLFIPNSALNLKVGKHNYYCNVLIRDVSNNYSVIGRKSQYMSFVGTGYAREEERVKNDNSRGAVKTIRYYGESQMHMSGMTNNLYSLDGYVDIFFDSAGRPSAMKKNDGQKRYLIRDNNTKGNVYKMSDDNDNSNNRICFNENDKQVTISWSWATTYGGITIRGNVLELYSKTGGSNKINNMCGNSNRGINNGTISGGGSQSGSVYTTCNSCGGSGVCRSCNGRGGEWRDTGYYTGSNNKSWINCPSCGGSGRCYMCHGRGKI